MANHQTKYANQRDRVTPPHVSLSVLRRACGLTLDQVCERIEEYTGKPFSRGSLSAVENGLRGASQEVIEGLAHAFDIKPEEIDTQYKPRSRA